MKEAKSKRNNIQSFEKELGLTQNDMNMLLYGIVCMKDGKVDYTLLAQRLGGPVPSTRTMYSRAHSKLVKKLKDQEGNNNRLDMAAPPASPAPPIAETSSVNTDAK